MKNEISVGNPFVEVSENNFIWLNLCLNEKNDDNYDEKIVKSIIDNVTILSIITPSRIVSIIRYVFTYKGYDLFIYCKK